MLNNIRLYLIFSFLVSVLLQITSYSQHSKNMYGVTIDGIGNINSIVASLGNHSRRMTTRIVFDEWQPASGYLAAVNKIDTVSDIMGEILDSYYMNSYNVPQFQARALEYIVLLGDKVDIWEIGNEVNGEWLGNKDSVMAKIYYAFAIAKKRQYKTAMTLYYNHNCWEDPRNEMFRWVNENVYQKMKNNLDYVLVSYYEDDCNNYQPNWQQVFDSLHVIFPNAKLGIGECGTTNASRKAEYITRYYTMNITTPNYIGGYFWWYYRQDCVPWNTKPLWQVLENAIAPSADIKDGDYKPINN